MSTFPAPSADGGDADRAGPQDGAPGNARPVVGHFLLGPLVDCCFGHQTNLQLV